MVRQSMAVLALVALLAQGCALLGAKAEEETLPLDYSCGRAAGAIAVDGNLDEPAWENAAVIEFILPITHEKPLSETHARLLYDDRYLYVGFRALDKDVYGEFKDRDAFTCLEDVLEVFIKPDPDSEPYYNFELNALGTMLDGFTPKRKAGGGRGQRWLAWNIEGMKIATSVDGTLNNYRDEDRGWSLEVAIPFAGLPTLQAPPRAGDRWTFHLARYDYSVFLEEGRELTSCAPLSKVDFHYYEDWIPLVFSQ